MSRGRWREHVTAIGAGLVVLATLSGPVLATLDQQYKREAPRRAEASEKERQAIRAIVSDPTEQAVAAEARERQRQQREQHDLNAQWTSAVAALVQIVISVGALAGLIATVFYARRAWLAARTSARADNRALSLAVTQLREARKTAVAERDRSEAEGRIQQDRFDRQITEATRTADAARDSADAASFIGRNQSRAYVHVSDARLDYTSPKTLLSTDAFEPHLYLRLQNVGATPTKLIRYTLMGDIETFSTLWRGFRKVELGKEFETMNVAPKDSQEVRVFVRDLKKTIEGDYAGANALNTKYFTIRGRIIYKDVFDKEHYTDFGFFRGQPRAGIDNPMEVITDGFARYEAYPPKE